MFLNFLPNFFPFVMGYRSTVLAYVNFVSEIIA